MFDWPGLGEEGSASTYYKARFFQCAVGVVITLTLREKT